MGLVCKNTHGPASKGRCRKSSQAAVMEKDCRVSNPGLLPVQTTALPTTSMRNPYETVETVGTYSLKQVRILTHSNMPDSSRNLQQLSSRPVLSHGETGQDANLRCRRWRGRYRVGVRERPARDRRYQGLQLLEFFCRGAGGDLHRHAAFGRLPGDPGGPREFYHHLSVRVALAPRSLPTAPYSNH